MSHASNKVEWCIKKAEKEINTADFEVFEKMAIKMLEQTKKIITPNKESKSGKE